MSDDSDPLEGLSGDARNYVLLKKRGEIPRHIRNYGDWLTWKKKREAGEVEPDPAPDTTGDTIAKIFLGIVAFLIVFAGLAYLATIYFWFVMSFLVALVTGLVVISVFGDRWFAPQWIKSYNSAARLSQSGPYPTFERFWAETKPAMEKALKQHHRRIILEPEVTAVLRALYDREVEGNRYNFPEPVEANAHQIAWRLWVLENPSEVVQNFRNVMVAILTTFYRGIPSWAFVETGTNVGSVALLDVMNVKRVVEVWVGELFSEEAKRLVTFNNIQHQLNLNRLKLSTKVFGKAAEGEHGRRLPVEDFTGTSRELIDAYLPETLFEPFFEASVAYRISQRSRFEHVHIVAPSGHGKTHGALETIVARDIEAGAGMVIISPNDELLSQIAHVATLHDFGAGTHSVTFIDPADAPALGIFDVHLRGDDQTITQVINEVSYFCETLIGSELTAPMSAMIAPLAQLMCTVPNSNLSTFIAAIDDLSQFSAEIERLPPRLREYLQSEMKTKSVGAPTKAAIKARLNSLLFKSPAFDRMFNATVNKVRVGEHLDGGGVLLVNCNDSFGQEQAQLLGKYFISRTLQALLQRPPGSARPAYLYIDEAWLFLDKMVVNLLRQARKYNVGLVICEPDMAHSEPGVQAGLDGVAVMLGAGHAASRMPMEKPNPELVSSMRTRPPHSADFALYDRHRAKRPVPLRVPMFELRKLPQISASQYRTYRRRNAERLQGPPESPPPKQSTADGQEW